MDAPQLTRDDFSPEVDLPAPGELVGWMIRNPDGKIIDWGPPVEAEQAATAEG